MPYMPDSTQIKFIQSTDKIQTIVWLNTLILYSSSILSESSKLKLKTIRNGQLKTKINLLNHKFKTTLIADKNL